MNTIKVKLILSLGALFVAAIALATEGYLTSRDANNGLRAVFSESVTPLSDLKALSDHYAVEIVDTAHKVRNGSLDWATGTKTVEEALEETRRHWSVYSATNLGQEERKMADAAGKLMSASEAAVIDLIAILKAHDAAALDRFVIERLYPAIDPLTGELSKLVDYQIAEAERNYKISNENFESMIAIMVGCILFSLCAMVYAAWNAVFGISRPLSALAGSMSKLAAGDFTVELTGRDREDEIGAIAKAVEEFKVRAAERAEAEMREKKLEDERRAAERRQAMHRLAESFQSSVGGIIATVTQAASQLEHAATSLTKTAETTQQLSSVVASSSEETSANVQGVAAASEELAATVNEISRQVQESSAITNEAVTQAAATNERVHELSRSADRIGNVIGLINTIAGQTNLLALNATIEAARAGDAGKGFAVVAQEVKALASQTEKATSEIASQIAGMQAATNETVNAIHAITDTIKKISQISGAIAAAVEQQSTTTGEITRNVAEAAKGTSEVAESITNVSRGATETGAASSEVLNSAKSLTAEGQLLRKEVEGFLAVVRAA